MRALPLVLAVALAGCSAAPDGRTSYLTGSGGSSSAYEAYRASRGATSPAPRSATTPAPEAAPPDRRPTPEAPPAAATVTAAPEPAGAATTPAEARSRRGSPPSDPPRAAGRDEPVGPVFEAPDGRKFAELPPSGWQCNACRKTYNVEGWCCGRPLRKTP